MAISGPVSIKKPAASARRCLFGPPDHQRIRKDLDRALSEMERSTKASLKLKWGFDAETETGVPGGRYEYSEVSSTDYVPQCYRKGYTTRSRRVTPRVDSASQMELEDLPVLPTTVSTSTQAGQGLDNPSAVSRTIIGVRRLDFKENCVLGSTSTPSSVSTQRVSRSSQRSSSVPSSLLQSTMTDHFQPRKRRSPDCDSSLPRGKSPRM